MCVGNSLAICAITILFICWVVVATSGRVAAHESLKRYLLFVSVAEAMTLVADNIRSAPPSYFASPTAVLSLFHVHFIHTHCAPARDMLMRMIQTFTAVFICTYSLRCLFSRPLSSACLSRTISFSIKLLKLAIGFGFDAHVAVQQGCVL